MNDDLPSSHRTYLEPEDRRRAAHAAVQLVTALRSSERDPDTYAALLDQHVAAFMGWHGDPPDAARALALVHALSAICARACALGAEGRPVGPEDVLAFSAKRELHYGLEPGFRVR